MTDFICQAQDFAGQMWCGRCRLDWPAALAGAAACRPKADPPIGIAEMQAALMAQAQAITDSQHAAVAAKFRREPYQPELRKAAVLTAAAQLLERVYRNEQIMELLKGGK